MGVEACVLLYATTYAYEQEEEQAKRNNDVSPSIGKSKSLKNVSKSYLRDGDASSQNFEPYVMNALFNTGFEKGLATL